MKILITGATGLVGTELTTLLLQKGIHVHYLTTSAKKIVSESNYTGFLWNPNHGTIDENALIGVDAIIHLAGANIANRWTESYKEEIVESRTVSANLLFKVLKNNPHQVKQIVSASGTAIYPSSLTEIYTEESQAIEDGFLSNVVVNWEQSADKFQQLGINVCKLRTGIVLSNKGGALSEMAKPVKFGVGSPLGSGKQFQSWIHLHDLANLYFFAVENNLSGVYNAVAPTPVSNAALTATIAKQLHKPLFMPNVPPFMLKLLLGEMHEILLSSQNVSNKKITDEGFKYEFNTIEKAIGNLL